MRAWFLPRDIDVMALLRDQAGMVGAGLDELADWVSGSTPARRATESLRERLTGERATSRAVHAAVRASFSTPLEGEDIFELTERLGELAEATYNLVREAEITATPADWGLQGIVAPIVDGGRTALRAVVRLPAAAAGEIGDRAVVELSLAEHAYRAAIVDLEQEDDLRREVRRRELYRRAEHLTASAVRLGRRVSYAVYKEG
jgi:hypothetical protein